LGLRNSDAPNRVLMGVAGELVVLNALARSASSANVLGVVESWCGSVPSSRDFQLGSVGLEVKTTAGSVSDWTRANRLVTFVEPVEDGAGCVGEVGVEGEALAVDVDGR